MPGLIDAQIIDRLLNAKLVIADLTFLNPNAFYEIGIRHVVGLPVIHMHREDEKIPFDVSLFRSLAFNLSEPQHLKAARSALKELLAEVLHNDHRVENPVTKARGQVAFGQNATPADVVLMDQVEALTAAVSQVQDRLSRIAQDPRGLDIAASGEPRRRRHGGDSILASDGVLLNVAFRNVTRRDTQALFDFVEQHLAPVLGGCRVIENNSNNLVIQVGSDGIPPSLLGSLNTLAKQSGVLVR